MHHPSMEREDGVTVLVDKVRAYKALVVVKKLWLLFMSKAETK